MVCAMQPVLGEAMVSPLASPETVLVAVEHRGLRFNLTRLLLSAGLFTTILHDGECAARLVGRSPTLRRPPLAIVTQCRHVEAAHRLLARIEELRWDAGIVVLVDPPADVRGDARRRGVVLVGPDIRSTRLRDVILERAA